jgi:hypothetical protein
VTSAFMGETVCQYIHQKSQRTGNIH